MHIPDGLMAPLILALGWLLAIPILYIVNRRLNGTMDEKNIPLMAVLAAGIFVAQMLNFPIGGGTTGHLVGAALAAILLGPLAGIVVITTILMIQCLLFGDGGLVALGLNIFNMAIIGVLVGWYSYTKIPLKDERFRTIIASWLSVVIVSLVCAIELAASYSLTGGDYGIKASIAFPTMLGYHVLIGIGEGIITTGVIAYLAKTSPEMLKLPKITFRHVKEAVP